MARPFVEFVAVPEQRTVVTGMALRRGHVFDAAVPVDVIVPFNKACRPIPRRIEFREAFDREFRPVFGGAEQRLGIGIIVADARPGIRRFDYFAQLR